MQDFIKMSSHPNERQYGGKKKGDHMVARLRRGRFSPINRQIVDLLDLYISQQEKGEEF